MARKTTRRPFCIASGVALIVGSACGGSKPCYDVQPGDRIAVTVVDVDSFDIPAGKPNPYDSGSPGTCGFGFDVSKGQVLVAKDIRNVSANGACLGPIAEFEPFGEWTWTLPAENLNTDTAPQDILAGSYDATNGKCSGSVEVSVSVSSGADPFAPFVPGQSPNVVLARRPHGSLAAQGHRTPTVSRTRDEHRNHLRVRSERTCIPAASPRRVASAVVPVRWLRSRTVYEDVGKAPSYALTAVAAALCAWKRSRRRL